MLYIPFDVLEFAQARNATILAAGLAQFPADFEGANLFAEIVEKRGKYYLPFDTRYAALYTESERASAVPLPPSPEEELMHSKTAREEKFARAIAYLEGIGLTTEQRVQIGLGVSQYYVVYIHGVGEQNNIYHHLLSNEQFLGQFPFITSDMAEDLRLIL